MHDRRGMTSRARRWFLSSAFQKVSIAVTATSIAALPAVATGADSSALEVRCGVVYSLHTRNAFGAWPNQITSAMGSGWPQMLLMTYAPFAAITNHASGPMTLASTARVEFDQPKLGIRLKRVGPTRAGFVCNQAIPLNGLYVNAHPADPPKRFAMRLFGGATGENPPSGQAILGAGETLVFSPWMPSTTDLEDVLDWRNNMTSSISCVPGWKGPSNGYCVDWLGGIYYSSNSAVNGGLGIVATRFLDQWDVEVQSVGALNGCRVFRPDTGVSGTWPWAPDASLEVTSFPFNHSDSETPISVGSMYVNASAPVSSWLVKPIFSVVLSPAATQLLLNDTNLNLIDDGWEQQYFGSQSVNRNADADGDGHTNYFEFLAGSSPVDGRDFIRTSLVKGDGNWRLEWSSALQRTYVVESSEDLIEWTPMATVTALETTCSHSLGEAGESARYFRLQILPPI
jgi:hypothetical protein